MICNNVETHLNEVTIDDPDTAPNLANAKLLGTHLWSTLRYKDSYNHNLR